MTRIGYRLRQTGEEVQAAIDKILALTTATPEAAGLLSAEDKAKLDALGIHYNTTEYWNNARNYVPGAGELVIYSDYRVVGGRTFPGIKIGSGNGFVQDLAFVGQEEADALMAHIADTAAHTTPEEKQFWNRKLNVDDEMEVEGDALVLNRN